MHLKRHKAGRKWMLERKEIKYVIRPSRSTNEGIPLLLVLREMLGIVKRRKEAERAVYQGSILINNKQAKNVKEPLLLQDTLTIKELGKHYRLNLSGSGKFAVEEISDKKAGLKIAKAINRTKIRGGKTQVNFLGGMNTITKEKININDSAVIENGKILKVLPLKEKAKVLVIGGENTGRTGQVEKIEDKTVYVDTEANEEIKVSVKNIMVVE